MSKLKDRINEDNERTIDDEEELEDLVDLTKEMHQSFYKGETNSNLDYKSAREHLRDYQENN